MTEAVIGASIQDGLARPGCYGAVPLDAALDAESRGVTSAAYPGTPLLASTRLSRAPCLTGQICRRKLYG